MNTPVIEAIDVHKRYGKTQALKGVSLTVNPGEIFSLLGPNGAGKTTLIKAILNLTPGVSGTVRINGVDSKRPQARRNIVFLPEVFQFYPDFTVEETVIFLGLMHGLSKDEILTKLPEALEKFSLGELSSRKNRTLSKGQLQRTALAHVYISGVSALILDEPFSGLDLVGVRTLEEYLINLQQEGKTILICSHALHELEKFTNRFAILKDGVFLTHGEINPLPDSAKPGAKPRKKSPEREKTPRKSPGLEEIYIRAIQPNKGRQK